MDEKVSEYVQKIEDMKEMQHQLQEQVEVLHKYSKKIEDEKIEEKDKRTKLEYEVLSQNQNHEAEVKLRLQFESKLNTMHAVYRKLDAQHREALSKIESLVKDNNLLKKGNNELGLTIKDISLEKVDLEARVESYIVKIENLQNEIRSKNKFIEDITEKRQETIREKDNMEYKLHVAIKDKDKIKYENDILKDQSQCKQEENDELRKDAKISKALIEQLRALYQVKIDDFEQLKKKFEDNELTIIGFNELQSEREDRITELKENNTKLKQDYDQHQDMSSSVQIDFEKLQEVHSNLQSSNEELLSKYHVLNKQRSALEVKLKNQIDLNKEHTLNIKERDRTINTLRKQVSNDEFKLINLKRDLEEKKLQIISLK